MSGTESSVFGSGSNDQVEDKAPVFGIDLGTTNSAISVVSQGTVPTNIKLLSGKYTMPSCVMWKDGEFIVGDEAYAHRGEPNVCYSIKRKMSETTYLANGELNAKACFTFVDGDKMKTMTATEISAEILKGLVRQTGGYYGEIRDVVVTVPAYFEQTARENTKQACILAGLNHKGTVNEPTAASLLYDLGDAIQREFIVYDLGGGTFDVTLAKATSNKNNELDDLYDFDTDDDDGDSVAGMSVKVIRTSGDAMLGGDDIDDALTRIAISRAVEKSPSFKCTKLQYEQTKRTMEIYKKESVFDTYSFPVGDVSVSIGPKDFASALYGSYMKTKAILDTVLQSATEDCKDIYLVGGSTKHPILRQMLEHDYPNMNINTAFSPDLSVTSGAAIFGKGIKFGDAAVQIFDIISTSIGLNDRGNFKPILYNGTSLPATGSIFMTSVREDQEMLHLELYQGRSRRTVRNTRLGVIPIKVPEGAKPNDFSVEVTLTVTTNNLLICSAKIGDDVIDCKIDLKG